MCPSSPPPSRSLARSSPLRLRVPLAPGPSLLPANRFSYIPDALPLPSTAPPRYPLVPGSMSRYFAPPSPVSSARLPNSNPPAPPTPGPSVPERSPVAPSDSSLPAPSPAPRPHLLSQVQSSADCHSPPAPKSLPPAPIALAPPAVAPANLPHLPSSTLSSIAACIRSRRLSTAYSQSSPPPHAPEPPVPTDPAAQSDPPA